MNCFSFSSLLPLFFLLLLVPGGFGNSGFKSSSSFTQKNIEQHYEKREPVNHYQARGSLAMQSELGSPVIRQEDWKYNLRKGDIATAFLGPYNILCRYNRPCLSGGACYVYPWNCYTDEEIPQEVTPIGNWILPTLLGRIPDFFKDFRKDVFKIAGHFVVDIFLALYVSNKDPIFEGDVEEGVLEAIDEIEQEVTDILAFQLNEDITEANNALVNIWGRKAADACRNFLNGMGRLRDIAKLPESEVSSGLSPGEDAVVAWEDCGNLLHTLESVKTTVGYTREHVQVLEVTRRKFESFVYKFLGTRPIYSAGSLQRFVYRHDRSFWEGCTWPPTPEKPYIEGVCFRDGVFDQYLP